MEILRRILSRKAVRVKDLAAEYGVHEMTIRRDLDTLAERANIERVHGGARLAERANEEFSSTHRATKHQAEKESIARAALGLIRDGETVGLDASTTCLALAKLLGEKDVLAIATCLDAAEALAASGVPFILAGGVFHPPARSFTGPMVRDNLSRLHPDKVFFSAKGVSATGGFTDANLLEAEAKSALIASGGMVVGLMDASKFGRIALATIVELHGVDALITDKQVTDETRAALDAADIRLIVAKEGSHS